MIADPVEFVATRLSDFDCPGLISPKFRLPGVMVRGSAIFCNVKFRPISLSGALSRVRRRPVPWAPTPQVERSALLRQDDRT